MRQISARPRRAAALPTAATVAVFVAVLGLCGCSLPSLSSLPAPKPINGPTYELSADFDDVLNLPIGAKVKQQGVVIGEVFDITTSNFVAHVRMHIAKSVKLPEGSSAQVRFTTPLGENYIAVQAPAEPDGHYLAAGTRLPRSATSSAPTIEDAFAALSLLINGGGLDKVGTIVAELNRSIRGREPTIRYVIEQMDALVGNLNAHKSDIDAALTGLNALSSRLAAGDDVITQALAQFPPALTVLADQTTNLNDLLTHVARLGNVAADVLNRGTSVLLKDLDLLRPALDSLSAARGTLVPTMQTLTKFGNLVVASSPGNYLNAAATLTLVFSDTALLPGTIAPSTTAQDAISRLIGGPRR